MAETGIKVASVPVYLLEMLWECPSSDYVGEQISHYLTTQARTKLTAIVERTAELNAEYATAEEPIPYSTAMVEGMAKREWRGYISALFAEYSAGRGMQIVDAVLPDRKQIAWNFQSGESGSSKFAVWHIGTGDVVFYTPEGREMVAIKHDIPLQRNGALATVNFVGELRDWGTAVSEQYGSRLYPSNG